MHCLPFYTSVLEWKNEMQRSDHLFQDKYGESQSVKVDVFGDPCQGLDLGDQVAMSPSL